MPESFGARMRQRREEQNIALSTIAEQSKIKLSLLEGLERDDVSRWPSGIFRRAYIRAYAQAIGLSPDETVHEFLETHPDPDDAGIMAATMAAATDRADRGGPPSRLRNMVDSAIESLVRLKPAARIDRRPAAQEPPAWHHEPEERLEPLASMDPPDTHRAVSTKGTTAPVLTPAELEPPASEAVEATDTPEALSFGDYEPAVQHEDVPPSEAAAPSSAVASPEPDVDLPTFARLCTNLARVDRAEAMQPLLSEAARTLGATGLIVWLWDSSAAVLRPVLAEGYSERVLAHLRGVPRDAENATASAFRSGELCSIDGGTAASGALAVPLLTPGGCSGVLALELPDSRHQSATVCAVATMLAAILAQLTCGAADSALPDDEPFEPPVIGETRPRRVNVRPQSYAPLLHSPRRASASRPGRRPSAEETLECAGSRKTR